MKKILILLTTFSLSAVETKVYFDSAWADKNQELAEAIYAVLSPTDQQTVIAKFRRTFKTEPKASTGGINTEVLKMASEKFQNALKDNTPQEAFALLGTKDYSGGQAIRAIAGKSKQDAVKAIDGLINNLKSSISDIK